MLARPISCVQHWLAGSASGLGRSSHTRVPQHKHVSIAFQASDGIGQGLPLLCAGRGLQQTCLWARSGCWLEKHSPHSPGAQSHPSVAWQRQMSNLYVCLVHRKCWQESVTGRSCMWWRANRTILSRACLPFQQVQPAVFFNSRFHPISLCKQEPAVTTPIKTSAFTQ